jgi:hypothetical protein
MVRVMNRDDMRTLAYCEECGNAITDEVDEYYCDEDGNHFCSCECVMEHYGIHTLEV